MDIYIHRILKFTFQMNNKNLNLCFITCATFLIFIVLIKSIILFLGNFTLLTQ